MSDRFYIETPIEGQQARLTGGEAQHAAKVMRVGRGDEIIVFDGSGAEFVARIGEIGRSEIELEIVSRNEIDREAPREILLAVALPKGDRQQWLVEKLTELGVRRLVPLVTERGVAQPVEKALERLRRWVVEASKQCGRNRLMEIGVPRAWREFASSVQEGAVRCLAVPGGMPARGVLQGEGAVVAAVGPEGGWTKEEIAVAEDNRSASRGASGARSPRPRNCRCRPAEPGPARRNHGPSGRRRPAWRPRPPRSA